MRTLLLLALLPSLTLAADAPPAKLDGVWEGYVVEGRGDDRNPRGPIHVQLTIKGDQIAGKQLNGRGGDNADMGTGTYTLAADGKFANMDATRLTNPGGGGGGGPRRGPGGGNNNRGGYKGIAALDGNTLKWCVANPGRDRPKDLVTDRGNQQFLIILKKVDK